MSYRQHAVFAILCLIVGAGTAAASVHFASLAVTRDVAARDALFEIAAYAGTMATAFLLHPISFAIAHRRTSRACWPVALP